MLLFHFGFQAKVCVEFSVLKLEHDLRQVEESLPQRLQVEFSLDGRAMSPKIPGDFMSKLLCYVSQIQQKTNISENLHQLLSDPFTSTDFVEAYLTCTS